MKTKLEMAHEWALVFTQQNKDLSVAAKTVSTWAFDYADAMQAEAEKRSVYGANWDKEKGGKKTFVNDTKQDHTWAGKEWQPDWSQAPEWANWWVMDGDEKTRWIYSELEQPYTSDTFLRWFAVGRFDSEDAPSFGYTGNWRNSLRKRPQ